MTDESTKVTALMTTESVIAGFMIAYSALIGQNLLYWADTHHHGSPFTTFLIGLPIYGIVLTFFRSLLLLFKSIEKSEINQAKYKAGYELFIAAMLGTGTYIILNALSTYHFTLRKAVFRIPNGFTPLASTVALILFFVYIALLLEKPQVVQWLGRIPEHREKRRIAEWVLAFLVAIFVLAVLLLGI
jgi:glucan phosphoethanolaminetransferase (alkaline phosphatase superfamily)